MLYLGKEAVVAVVGEVSFNSQNLRRKNTYTSILELQVVSGAVSLPRFR